MGQRDGYDLLAHVAGQVRADTSNIEIVTPVSGGKAVLVFDLDAFIKRGGTDAELPEIRAGATIRVHDLPQDPVTIKPSGCAGTGKIDLYFWSGWGPGMFTMPWVFSIFSALMAPRRAADLHNIRINHRTASMSAKLNLAYLKPATIVLPK